MRFPLIFLPLLNILSLFQETPPWEFGFSALAKRLCGVCGHFSRPSPLQVREPSWPMPEVPQGAERSGESMSNLSRWPEVEKKSQGGEHLGPGLTTNAILFHLLL